MKFRLPKTRRYRIYIYAASILLIVLAIDLIWVRIGRHVTIGYDTTRITGPLRSDGRPDYFQAIEERSSAGVTLENNAAPMLIAAIGPEFMPQEELRSEIYARLQMAPLPADGQYFVPLEEFLKGRSKFETPERMWDEINGARGVPWSAAEHAEIAAWLQTNAVPMEKLRAAEGRERNFIPCAHRSTAGGLDMVMSLALPNLHRYQDLGDAFLARAMLRAHEGNMAEAREDFRCALHLASLIGQGPSLMEHLISLSIESRADHALMSLVRSEDLTANESRQLLDLVRAEPMRRSLAETLEAERYSVLDAVTLAAKIGPVRFLAVLAPEGHRMENADYPFFMGMGDRLRPLTPGDFNRALVDVNRYFDQIVPAAKLITYATAIREERAIDAEMGSRLANVQRSYFPDPAQLALSCVMPAFGVGVTPEYRIVTERGLTQISLALAAYHAEQGGYPETLAALAPGILGAVPSDAYLDGAMHFVRTEKGYRLYSVGPNMRDDDGQGRDKHDEAHPGADDLGVVAER